MEINYGGLLYEVSEQDYLLGADGLDIGISDRAEADDKIVEYNQLDLPNGQNSCTIHACCGAVSDLMGNVYSIDGRQALWDSALALDASETSGWYFWKAVDHIRRDWNKKNPFTAIVSFRINYAQKEFDEALSRGHSLVGGYRGNAKYNEDADDGRLEGTEFGTPTYGHCIRLRKKDGVYVVDNYLGKKLHNTYEIADFKALVENKTFFDEFYLYLPLAKMTQDEKDLLEAFKAGIWNNERPDEPVTRKECVLMIQRALRSKS